MLQTLPRAARRFGRDRSIIAEAVRRSAAREWAAMGADFDTSWWSVGPRLAAVVVAGQRRAVETAGGYVDAVTSELGLDAPPVGAVNADRLVGVASDGRTLGGLLRHGVVEAKLAVQAGASQSQALALAGRWVQFAARTQVVDTMRVAAGLHGTARGLGYVRMLQGASCGRCVILAGRHYRWSSGFQRHPRCDCVNVPVRESLAGDMTVDPRSAFDAMTVQQQVKAFGAGGAQAIRDGVDPTKVVNLRGLGTAGGRELPGARLMPEAIYRRAGSHDEALQLLRTNGYLN